jgi:hypothetical protein
MSESKDMSESKESSFAVPFDGAAAAGSSDGFKARHRDVFNFDERKIKIGGAGDTGNGGGGAGVTACGGDKDDNKSVTTDDKSGATDDFTGRESLFRIPDSEWRDDGERRRRRGAAGAGSPRGGKPYSDRSVPYRPPAGRGELPNFRKDATKYTKYSLADVDMPTSSTNSRAAFDFLSDLKKKRVDDGEEEEGEERMEEGAKITFKKPIKRRKEEEEDDDKVSDVASEAKIVLPACEVGTAVTKKKKRDDEAKNDDETKGKKKSKKNQMTLSHLMDDEEDE